MQINSFNQQSLRMNSMAVTKGDRIYFRLTFTLLESTQGSSSSYDQNMHTFKLLDTPFLGIFFEGLL